MATSLTVNGNVFSYPGPGGDSAGWNEEATGWAVEVTRVLSSIQNANDILETTFLLSNGQVTPANITGMVFNTSTVRSAVVEYSIYISTSTAELQESGELVLGYKSTAAEWTIAQRDTGEDSEVVFSILASGQVQYISSTVAGTGYSGTIKFTAKTISQ